MRELKLTPNLQKSKSSKGRDTQHQILETALTIFIKHGYGDFSIQKVADSCGLSRGNVSYYYPTKNSLLHGLLQAVVQGYVDEFEQLASDTSKSPEDRFLAIIHVIMADLATEETSFFFPELWALSNRNKDAMIEMNYLYKKAREHIIALIGDINPSLTKQERELVGLFVSASMEGHTPFVGHKKEWTKSLPALTNIAAFSFLELVKNISKKDIVGIKMVKSNLRRNLRI